MKFFKTPLEGTHLIEIDKIGDERGFFARIWDKKEFEKLGLDSNIVQSSISFNIKRGTIRGMHFQLYPYEETKIVSCTRGRIFDVVIDLRKDSSTYKRWYSVELSEDNYKFHYIPKGVAHGFQTLEDRSVVLYQMTSIHSPKYYCGVRWNDPMFDIKWPLLPSMISKKDSIYPDYSKEI